MSSLAAAIPRLVRRSDGAVSTGTPRRWPVESTCLFLIALILYSAVADYLVIHLHYTNGDAYSRVADATYVLYSRDPHLGAIGFIWPPLPALLNIPILSLAHWFPFLISRAFAGSVEAALFGAGSAVLINSALRRIGIAMPLRWLVVAVWIANPMTALYSAQGMSEAPFVFFVLASFLSFLRWTESRRAAELAALGVLVGLGTLVRIEFVPVAMVIGAGVVFCSLGRKVGWRQLETQVLLYALPALFMFGLWIGSMAVIEHDPLYFLRSDYKGQAAVEFGSGAATDFNKWSTVATHVGQQYLDLFPVVVVLLGAVMLRALVARNRGPALVMLALAAPVPLVDMYLLHSGSLALVLRYQIYVIPYAMVLGIFLLKELRKLSRWVASAAAVALVVLMGVSNVSSFDLMSNVQRAPEEAFAIQAAENNVSAGSVSSPYDPYDISRVVSQAVADANKDHGLIAMDTYRGGSVYLTAPDRSYYIITSDEDFQAIINQPQVYHCEYFLVPEPVQFGSLDKINQLYPSLWANGDMHQEGVGNSARLVANIGGASNWRLYKINLSTSGG